MAFQKLITALDGSWRSLQYGQYQGTNEMYAADKPREYVLDKLEIKMLSGKKYDIREMVIDFAYHESIESSFLRCEFSILDTLDFNRLLQGGETVTIKAVTATAFSKEPLEVDLMIYKIGAISKSERGQLYVLHCVSPEMYSDESNKVFKGFGPGDGAMDGDCIPRLICENYLKKDGNKNKIKEANFENHSKYTFIACSWKPSDAIAFISDKVTRLTKSKGENKQGGFLFWENRNGFNFRSIDSIAQGQATQTSIYEYTYAIKSLSGVDARYAIETITYPDKANHLTNMRMGTYKTSAIGVQISAAADSYAPDSGNKEETEDEGGTEVEGGTVDTVTANKGSGLSSAPGGTVSKPRILTFNDIFGKADTVEKARPYEIPEFFDLKKSQPTRMKIRALPALKNQTSTSNTNNGTNPNIDTMAVAQYAAARYNLLKSVKLDITVPGNSALTAGALIKVVIPASRNDGETVMSDTRFSGLYVIAGLTHVYRRAGFTTKLYLVRDSQPRQSEKVNK
jgi:hypothetical protein|tara:strand:- start:589 stop:2124 length:1536 start_codon:yes stop_codon:yes gene_type:complete